MQEGNFPWSPAFGIYEHYPMQHHTRAGTERAATAVLFTESKMLVGHMFGTLEPWKLEFQFEAGGC